VQKIKEPIAAMVLLLLLGRFSPGEFRRWSSKLEDRPDFFSATRLKI
jgi:hypothetical protein